MPLFSYLNLFALARIARRRVPKSGVTCLILASLTISFCALADDIAKPEWEQRKDLDGIVVSQRAVANSNYLETRGTMQSDAPLFAILAVLRDALNCGAWLYDCKHSEVIEQRDIANNTVYTIIDAPLFLKDRDLYARSQIKYFQAEGRIEINLEGDENYQPVKRKRVRVLNFTAKWILKKTANGTVTLDYQVHSNPQISLAKTVNNTMITSVFETLRDVNALAKQDPYLGSKPSAAEIAAITAATGHP